MKGTVFQLNDEKDTSLKSFLKKLAAEKKYQYAVIVIIIVILLFVYFFTGNMQEESVSEESSSIIQEYKENNESSMVSEMESILSSIKGAGSVKVMVTYESSSEIVTAMSEENYTESTTDGDGSEEISENKKLNVVTIKDDTGENALVVKEVMPEISGVIVTAEGAGNITVKMSLIDAVTTLLDIPAEKVSVFEMDINDTEVTK